MADATICTYAAMILHDCGAAPTADKIAAVAKAAGANLRPTVPVLFANFLSKKSIGDLISASAATAPAAGASAGAASAAPAAAAADKKADGKKDEPKKDDKKKAKEPEPADDDDLFGGGLF
jgi:large subunit ribosomal protein LP1